MTARADYAAEERFSVQQHHLAVTLQPHPHIRSVLQSEIAGAEWLLIVAEMDKAGGWGASSESALLTLAREIAGG